LAPQTLYLPKAVHGKGGKLGRYLHKNYWTRSRIAILRMTICELQKSTGKEGHYDYDHD
jgi:hypothetical protein